MLTLLQTLLLQALPNDLDPVLLTYVETVLPSMEREFEAIPVLGGAKIDRVISLGKLDAMQQVIYSSNDTDQSLLSVILNSLLIAWNLLPFLSTKLSLSDTEKRLLCIGFAFQGYNNRCQSKAPLFTSMSEIALGEALNLDVFWAEWRKYLPKLDSPKLSASLKRITR